MSDDLHLRKARPKRRRRGMVDSPVYARAEVQVCCGRWVRKVLAVRDARRVTCAGCQA